jgi:hypothetical protein
MARGVRARTGAVLAAAFLLMGAGAAGCGDDGGGTGEPKKPPKPTTSTSASEGPATGEPDDVAAAEKEVTTNWETFFSADSDMDERADLLEDGDTLQPLMEAFAGDERQQQVRAVVNEVEFTSPEEATVRYALLLEKATAVPTASGVAVLEDGTWKVAKKTLCGLIELSGSPAPGC